MGLLRRRFVLSSLIVTIATFAGFALGGAQSRVAASQAPASDASRAAIVAEVKRELATEMGLVPVALMRDRR